MMCKCCSEGSCVDTVKSQERMLHHSIYIDVAKFTEYSFKVEVARISRKRSSNNRNSINFKVKEQATYVNY